MRSLLTQVLLHNTCTRSHSLHDARSKVLVRGRPTHESRLTRELPTYLSTLRIADYAAFPLAQ